MESGKNKEQDKFKEKNKKLLFILGGLVLLALIVGIIYFVLDGKKYIVTFDSNGGSSVESISAKENEVIKLPDSLTKEGYTFTGWMDGDVKVSNDYKVLKSITLTASWLSSTVETITIKFDSNGGSKVADIILEKGKTLKLPANPTKSGYVFKTWQDSNSMPIYDDALLDGDVTLYAVWEKIN